MCDSPSTKSIPKFSLFGNEKKVLAQSELLAQQGVDDAEGMRSSFKELIIAYQQSCSEQEQLVRLGDRLQEQLRRVSKELREKNHLLEDQAKHLMVLNTELAHEIETRKALEMELRVLATTDPLTGLYNRRRFLELGEYEIQREHRNHRGLALLALDLDHFKQVNDKFGHAAGDEVLRRFACICKGCLRAMDSIGRTGGEEFAILLPESGPEEACLVAERIRAGVEACPMPSDRDPFHVTVSIGAAGYRTGDNFDQLLARADTNLYAAKNAGRNRVESGAAEQVV
jgi:diguanylate cyclase (GGDEF)-like protein